MYHGHETLIFPCHSNCAIRSPLYKVKDTTIKRPDTIVIDAFSGAGVPLIIDTDASVDVDDVVAICMAHALMDRGEVDIKAIVHDAGIPEGIGAMSVLNHFYGRDDILLGAYKVRADVDTVCTDKSVT